MHLPSLKYFHKPLAPLNLLTLLTVAILSSCTVALPEFQSAQSLPKSEHNLVAGPFTGRGLNASTGISFVHGYGLSDQIDLNSHVGFARLNVQQPNIKYSVLTGPKFSTPNQKWALSLPIGAVYLDYLGDIDDGITGVITPTLYRSFYSRNRPLTHSLFIRSELAYNYLYEDWFWVVGGYALQYETDRFTHYLSITGTQGGIYAGYGISLNKMK